MFLLLTLTRYLSFTLSFESPFFCSLVNKKSLHICTFKKLELLFLIFLMVILCRMFMVIIFSVTTGFFKVYPIQVNHPIILKPANWFRVNLIGLFLFDGNISFKKVKIKTNSTHLKGL